MCGHNNFLIDRRGKMSKSRGEFLRLQSIVDRGFHPLAYRLFCLQAHYRSEIEFSWENLLAALTRLKRLVMGVHSYDQFVFLIADDEPMIAPRLDHFGLAVDTLDQLHTVLDRAKAYRERDDRVDIIDYDVEDHGVLKLHNFYAGFLLPMMVEVQCFEFTESIGV